MKVKITNEKGENIIIDAVNIETIVDDATPPKEHANFSDIEFQDEFWKLYLQYQPEDDDEDVSDAITPDYILKRLGFTYYLNETDKALLRALLDFNVHYAQRKLSRMREDTYWISSRKIFDNILKDLEAAKEEWLDDESPANDSPYYQYGDLFIVRTCPEEFILIWSIECTYLY